MYDLPILANIAKSHKETQIKQSYLVTNRTPSRRLFQANIGAQFVNFYDWII